MIGWLATSLLVRAMALALLHFVWQGALLAAALWLLLRVAGRSAARARYLYSCAALALAAALPAITVAALWPALPPALPAAGAGAAPAVLPWHAYATLALVGAWLAGAALRLARIGIGLRRIRVLLGRCAPLRDEIAERARRLARRMGLSRVPRLLETKHADVPMAVGWLRPAVLIPLSAITALPPAQLDALIAHELAHVRRHDFLVNLLSEVVLAALFFHPAVHFIARSIREAREHVADDEASAWVAPRTLARALFALESHRTQPPELSLGSTGGDLVQRIQRLIEARQPARGRAALPALAAAGALFAAALVGLGSCGGAGETAPPVVGAQAATALQIRWLPPVLSPYKALFEGAAQKHGVDADVLAIVTLVESEGDAAAQSSAGALGLMQIMPKTGAQIAEERGVAGFAPERLREPSLNVDFGAWYFARQAATFGAGEDGSAQVALASAAYNAGPKAVRAYLDSGTPLPEETQKYRALVVGMYEERGMERSATFDAWRGRVQGRVASKARSPVPASRVTGSFGAESAPYRGPHTGVDLAAEPGTPVMAPLDGTVVATEKDDQRGLVVVVRHRSGIETRYHHLDSVAVKAGDRVAQGDAIGTVGSTGVVTGPHVHFEVRDLGTPVDPAPYLAKAP